MKRGTQLKPFSAKRLAQLEEQGISYPTSTFAPKAGGLRRVGRQRPADTGPTRSVRDLVRERSGGMCEWPSCPELATDAHHRLGRKQGGRHGEASVRINGAAWLLHSCRVHHAYVTSPYGHRRQVARSMGWLLLEHEDAARVPVWTRHHDEPVWLLANGTWVKFEEAAA